jgi:hypothetical protein
MAYYWKVLLVQMTGNGFIFKVDAFMYNILNKAENHLPFGELVGTIEGITL